jgi:hypothetical protein
MGQSNGFDQVFIQSQGACNRAAKLRHLQRMREPGAKQVAFMVQKNLGFVDQPAKRSAVNDAVTVALKFGTRGGRTLKKPPPT